MKLFNTTAAILMLVVSALLGNSALAQTAPTANCSVLYTDASAAVGSVCVTVNPIAANVFVDYTLIGDWKLSKADAWIGDNSASLPTSGGNPQVSAFPHSISYLVGVTEHSFIIPFAELGVNLDTFCNADVIVAASAVVTRTVAGSGGGKSDKSGKSGKSGKSDKSGKSGQSDKSAKSEKSDKNSKNSKAEKSVKSNSSKAKNSAAKNSKGSSKVASKGKSNKSGKSGQSGKSGKSGKSGSGSGPVTETLTVWAGDNIVGNGAYFSFSNDFCGPVEPPVITLPNDACYNVFAGTSDIGTPFSPVGITSTPQDSISGWVNTFPAAQGGFGAPFLMANNQSAGNLLAVLLGNGTMQVNISVPVSFEVYSSNIYIDAAGSFVNVSPTLYGTSATKPNAAAVLVNLPASSATSLDLVVHAVLCPAGSVN